MSGRLFRIVVALFALALIVAQPFASLAKNPCEDGGAATPGNGTGGTGRSNEPGGIGGTGNAPDNGIGGTGRSAEQGIGGTGHGPNEPGDGGIGGTGRARAIVGIVTGYASLCVAGIEVRVDTSVLATASGNDRLPAIGETVEVVATGEGGSVRALSLARRPILVGPVDSVDGDRSIVHVLGQDVVFDEDTRSRASDGGDSGVTASSFTEGANVRVSGWRRLDGSIQAVRIDAATDTPALISGTVTRVEGDHFEVDGTRVDAASLHAAGPSVGDGVIVVGRAHDSHLVASEVTTPIADLLRRGLVRLDADSVVGSDGRATVGPLRLPVPRGEKVHAGERVRVTASFAPDGSPVVDRMRPAIPPHRPDFGIRAPGHLGPAPIGGHPAPPPRLDRPERPPFPGPPPRRPPRPGGRGGPPPPPPPPPRIPLPNRH